MNIWAIVPVKSLTQSKRRLAHLLSVDERVALIKRLFCQILSVLKETAAIDRILVVSGDPDIWTIAGQYGVQVVKEPASQGLNLAVERGVNVAHRGGADAVVILPVDLPFVSRPAVTSFLAEVSGYSFDKKGAAYDNGASPLKRKIMAICPDENEEGTNALFLGPISEFSFHYGPGSFQAHVREGEEKGFSVKIVSIPQLQFDLDSEDDWLVYQASAVIDC